MRRVSFSSLLFIFSLMMACNQPPSGGTDPNSTTAGGDMPLPDTIEATDAVTIPGPAAKVRLPVEPAPAAVAAQTALLNEVLFLPAEGQSQFVELRSDANG